MRVRMSTCAVLCRVQKLTTPGISQLLFTLSFSGKVSHWNWSLPVWLGGRTAGPRDPPASLTSVLELKHAITPSFHGWSGGSDSGHDPCVKRTLISEPSLQPQKEDFEGR